jgi:hypothetical protein
MRLPRALPLLGLLSLGLLGAVSCDTADDVRGGVEGARSSAASIAAGTRQACQASESSRKSLGDLAQKLSDNPDLRQRLAPQVRSTVDKLVSEIGSRPELGGTVAAARDLSSAVGDANATQVKLAAQQAVVAVKGAQGVCDLAT